MLAAQCQSVHHVTMFGNSRPICVGAVLATALRRSAVLSGSALLVCSLFAASPVIAGDGINCSCVANGQRVELGELFCIRTASGKQFLARCERVLNNTSWKRLQDGCPSAHNQSRIIEKAAL